MADKAYLERITKELVDKGKLIESGWVGLRLVAIEPNAPAIQLQEMRMAFFAGAQHLWASVMTFLDEDAEPTEQDLARMDKIETELTEFFKEFATKHGIELPDHMKPKH